MADYENQHYVPQAYLKGFGKGKMVFTSKNGKKPKEKSVKKVCSAFCLYDVEGFELEPKHIEKFYGKEIDNNFRLIREFLSDSRVREITEIERETIIHTLLCLVFRHLDFIKQAENEEDLIVDLKGKKVNYSKAQRITSHLNNWINLSQSRLKNGISVSFAEPGYEFITSDKPVYIFNPNFTGLDSSQTIHLPITPHMCITFLPNDEILDNTFQKSIVGKDHVFLINSRIYEQSKDTIIGTEKGLENFLKRYVELIDPNEKLNKITHIKKDSQVMERFF